MPHENDKTKHFRTERNQAMLWFDRRFQIDRAPLQTFAGPRSAEACASAGVGRGAAVPPLPGGAGALLADHPRGLGCCIPDGGPGLDWRGVEGGARAGAESRAAEGVEAGGGEPSGNLTP